MECLEDRNLMKRGTQVEPLCKVSTQRQVHKTQDCVPSFDISGRCHTQQRKEEVGKVGGHSSSSLYNKVRVGRGEKRRQGVTLVPTSLTAWETGSDGVKSS